MESNYYKEYYHLERLHWWFKARSYILESQIQKRIITENRKLKILNVGVATGATTKMLENFGEVVSVEYDNECCQFLKNQLNIEAIEASLTDLPFDDNTFDLVCAFDVIEHIEDDDKAVMEINRVLKIGGNFVITVPAYNFLWSNHDIINHHYRRYTSSNLSAKIQNSNLKISFKSYFNFYFFLPIFLIRMIKNVLQKLTINVKKEKENTGSNFEIFGKSKLLNDFLYLFFKTENYLLSLNIRFPIGVSILFIGEK